MPSFEKKYLGRGSKERTQAYFQPKIIILVLASHRVIVAVVVAVVVAAVVAAVVVAVVVVVVAAVLNVVYLESDYVRESAVLLSIKLRPKVKCIQP